jgi:enoyl-CoA hydratase/carnithine racemase
MTSEAVTYEVRGTVAWLTISRPEARNALNKAVRDGLLAGVRRFNADEAASVLVLTAAGDLAFCAGGDLKEMAQTHLTMPAPDLVPQFGRTIEVAERIWEPVYLSEDAQEGPAAFAAKRAPAWKGR